MTDHLKLRIIIEIFTHSVTKKPNIIVCKTLNSSFSNLSSRDVFPCNQVDAQLNAFEKSDIQFRIREHQEYSSLLAICVAYMLIVARYFLIEPNCSLSTYVFTN